MLDFTPALVDASQSVLSPLQPWSMRMVGAGLVAPSGIERSVSRPMPSKLGISPVQLA